MNITTQSFAVFALACLAVGACTPAERSAERPQSTRTPGLETGITELWNILRERKE